MAWPAHHSHHLGDHLAHQPHADHGGSLPWQQLRAANGVQRGETDVRSGGFRRIQRVRDLGEVVPCQKRRVLHGAQSRHPPPPPGRPVRSATVRSGVTATTRPADW